ncbi:MAG: Bro-N domain-containing protein [Lachnospiraceae bacterium]|nr:Bro-N domain-containing protein [Ruminococcus sp.]MCM1277198.1 Bro-N domain-containing protein [Lachnospiraceae bacterium]
MDNELQLVKTDKFGEVEYNIYSDNEEMYMTARQLGECLEYSDPMRAINKLAERNSYLLSDEFSSVVNLTTLDGKNRDVRVFNEDGIYEVTMLAKTDVAKAFRARVRTVLKGIRKGTIVAAVPDKSLEIQERDSLIRLSEQYLKISNVDTLSKEYKNILAAKAAEVLSGTPILPLPKSEQKMYSAGEIGKILGVSGQLIGRLSNKYGIKTDEYGEWYRSKSKYSNKEINTFVYNDRAIEKFRALLLED